MHRYVGPRCGIKCIACLLFVLAVQTGCYCQLRIAEGRIARLDSSIERTLRETNAPGAGIAIVTSDGPVLIKGYGKANLERGIDATRNTLFRIASISKMFVALSVLKLQEEGKLHLQDKVRDIVPEVEFDNPWEETHPVRIVHLLEHTTGWDEYHLVEQTNVPLTLKGGVDFHPHSRRSRWVPGSRMAYSNSGFGVAGYIIEKVSGRTYEEYVEENFFRPLNMTSSTFFNDEKYRKWGATLYDRDRRSVSYRHLIQRPVGAINSSPEDMARFLRFMLNRGLADSVSLLSEQSLLRMEVTKSTPGARAGLELGYGLANSTTVYQGFVYQGHNGALPAALSELGYLPVQGIGHVILMNSRNSAAFRTISNLVRNFEMESIQVDSTASHQVALADFSFKEGYYASINPRMQAGYFMDRLIDVYKFSKKDSVLVKSWLLPNATQVFYPVSDSTFRYRGLNKVSLVKAIDPLEGEVLFMDSRVYKPIPTFMVYGQLALVALWITMMGLGGLVWAISLAAFWSGRSSRELRVTRYPMLTTVFFILTAFLLLWSQRHHNDELTSPGLLSLTLMAVSVWFILSAVWSVVVIIRERKEPIPRLTYWSMAILSALHMIVVAYLVWFDVLPVMSWT